MEKRMSLFSLGTVFAEVTLQLFQKLCEFMSWFNPGRQLGPTQPLTHFSLVG